MVWCSSFAGDYSADTSGARASPTSSFRVRGTAARARLRDLRSTSNPVERASTSKGERTAGLLGLSGRRDALLAVLLRRR